MQQRTHRARSVKRSLLPALVLLVGLTHASQAQIVRPPDLKQEYHRAERAWRTGTNLYEAKIRLDRVIDALPDDAQARLIRARVLLGLDRPQEAITDARRATELMPDDGGAWLVLAESAHRVDPAGDEALHAIDRAAEHVTEGAREHVRLSWLAQSVGQLDRAEAFARIALALDPGESACYWRLAGIFLAQDRPDDAATMLARGLTEGALSSAAVREHPEFGSLASHPTVRPLLDG